MMHCNPCSRRDVESKSTSWCIDCEEGLCSKCLEDHQAIKLTGSHHVIDMKEQISPEYYEMLSTSNCKWHHDLQQDVVCKDHDVICCRQCFQTSHKSCKNVCHLNRAAKGIKQSDWLKKLGHDLKEMAKVSHKIIEERRVSKEELKNQIKKIKKAVSNIKSKFIQHIDDLEKDLLSELATVDKDGEEESGKEKQELMNMEKEVQADQTALEFVTANGSESQIYSFVQNQSEKLKERVKKLQKIPPNSKVNIELHEASHEIEGIKSLGYLSVNYEKVTNPLSVESLIDNDESLSRTESKDFPNLTLEKEKWIDPKDFLAENERVDDMDLNVQCATVTDDNYILVAGILGLVINGKYKTVLQLVKYDEHMKYLQQYRFFSLDRIMYDDAKIYGISSIQNSDRVVIVYQKILNREMLFASKATMKKTGSINLDNYGYTSYRNKVILDSNSKRIFLYTEENAEKICLFVFDVLGCCVQELDFDLQFDSFIAQPNNTFWGLFNNTLYVSKEDGTESMSYSPYGLSAVTIDHHGNLFMVMEDGIQVMHPKKKCVHLAFTEPLVYKDDKSEVIGFHSFNKSQTKLLLVTIISPKDHKFRNFGKGNERVPNKAFHVKLISEGDK
ncbi:uncharacterized protein LOC143076716 isoform X1 [Mytilus galloprovincialis]|uniref:uncharacterized protein LOC143076716 isoform X1 n=1 Tax=Mytilus galloprovincialis TaxID=29158 RepID=UPI003F7C0872